MTTLAAYQGDGWIVMGGDSQSSDQNGFKVNIPGGKIFENNGIVIGGAGDVTTQGLISRESNTCIDSLFGAQLSLSI